MSGLTKLSTQDFKSSIAVNTGSKEFESVRRTLAGIGIMRKQITFNLKTVLTGENTFS